MKKIAAAIIALTASAFAQGPLNPPAGPAPTMKTLLELWNKLVTVETQATGIQAGVAELRNDPRSVITTAPFTITNPGSYILGANLSLASGSAIIIAADDVTLDLNGFAIIGYDLPAGGNGVLLRGLRRNVHVKNGTIKGTTLLTGNTFAPSGFANGILCDTDTCRNIIVSDLRISGVAENGVNLGIGGAFNSIRFAPGLVVERTSVSVCGANGIIAHSVRACEVVDAGATAISANVVADSSAASVSLSATAYGISARIVTGSSAEGKGGHGISGTNIFNSMGRSDSANGIFAVGNVTNSHGLTGTGDYGINVSAGTASFCRGGGTLGGAIFAPIAIGCTRDPGTVIFSPSKHLGTP